MVSMIYVVTYAVAAIATFGLAVYFIREYFIKKLSASLAWALGLGLYGFAMVTDISTKVAGEVSVGKPAIGIGLVIFTLSLTLFYYGSSQLFFSKGSFFREKMSVVIFVLFMVLNIVLLVRIPLEGFRDLAAWATELIQAAPIFLVIAILFYRVSRRLAGDDPRRRIVSLVSAGWTLAFFNAVYLGTQSVVKFESPIGDAVINLLHAVAWVFILYGMAIGKAART